MEISAEQTPKTVAIFGGTQSLMNDAVQDELLRHYPVNVWVDPDISVEELPHLPIDGVILLWRGTNQYEAVRRVFKGPIVSVGTGPQGSAPWAGIELDLVEMGRMAARHLLERGYSNFAYYSLGTESIEGPPGLRGFHDVLQRDIAVYSIARPEGRWDDAEELKAWLNQQERPLGLFVPNTNWARKLLMIGRRMGWSVPEELAVVGGVNHSRSDALSFPRQSYIEFDLEGIARKAVNQLMAMIAGRSEVSSHWIVPPKGMVIQASSDAYLNVRSEVVKLLRTMQDTPPRSWQVSQLCVASGLTRRHLDQLCQRDMGATVAGLLRQRRFALAEQAVKLGEQSLEIIAYECGYSHLSHMNVDFKQRVGCSPRAHGRSS